MASKTKHTKRLSKRRLALPASWVKNIEEAGKNIKVYQHKGIKEAERIYNKVIEIDFVKKARKHEVVRKATEAGNRFTHEVESWLTDFRKNLDDTIKNARKVVPIPTRSEIESLTRKINELSKKIEEVAEKRVDSAVSAVKRSA